MTRGLALGIFASTVRTDRAPRRGASRLPAPQADRHAEGVPATLRRRVLRRPAAAYRADVRPATR